jgi:hypothetical protein
VTVVRGRTAVRIGLAITGGLLVAVALGLAWLRLAPRRVPAGQPPLVTLGADSLPAFRDTFNAHDDEIRLLVLLSPT